MSSVVPTRPSGIARTVASLSSGSFFQRACIGLSVALGRIALERILSVGELYRDRLRQRQDPAFDT